jgi:phage-related protein
MSLSDVKIPLEEVDVKFLDLLRFLFEDKHRNSSDEAAEFYEKLSQFKAEMKEDHNEQLSKMEQIIEELRKSETRRSE